MELESGVSVGIKRAKVGMKKSTFVLTVALLLVVFWAYVLGWLKTRKQQAREAIERVEYSCLHAREHGGIDVALGRQYGAKWAVEKLDYEDQPPYRAALNEAWEPCADYTTHEVVKHDLEPKGHPVTPQEIEHFTRQERINMEAALDFLNEHAKKRSRTDSYPYPDD